MNPHELIGQPREVWWGDLHIGFPVELELVDYFRANSRDVGRGCYISYYAVASADYPPLSIRQGDNLILHMAYKCFRNELMKLPDDMRVPTQKKFAEGKNLYIKLEKMSRERVKIHSQEVREPTEQQLSDSAKFYKIMKG